MNISCCSVCQTRYDEEERCPLLLECGHGFCKDCLSKMLSASPDTSFSCPRCHHVSTVGNSVLALRKNFPILSLLRSSDLSEPDDSDSDANGGGVVTQGCCGGGKWSLIKMGRHRDVQTVRRIGGEVWA